MGTTQVRIERRAAQRFDFQLPVSVRVPGSEAECQGFTQDLSGRGIFFFTDVNLRAGDAVELTFVMPGEITLSENMRVRCRARVTRVTSLGADNKRSAAAHFHGYEYLPTAVSAPRDTVRSQEEDTAMSVHTFDWHGSASLAPH